MLPIPDEVKEKLVKALDDENDVDDATVVEMVSVLEKYPITRATLEETKIGKMVNDLRRKIKNEKLAKRVKQLVRNWKKILDETPPVNGGVPGPMHPAISQLRSSPAISPALTRVASTGSLGSLAQGKVSPAQRTPGTPKQVSKKNASPALAGYRPVAASSRKALSPGVGTNGSSASATAAHKTASPALSGGHSRVASPALAASTTTSAVSGRVLSPVASRGEAKAASGRVASPLVSGRVTSPAVLPAVGHVKGSSLLAQSSVQSPKLHPAVSSPRDHGAAADRSRRRKVASSNEAAKAGDRSLTVVHSEQNQDRLAGEVNKGWQESEEESSLGSSKLGDSDNAYPYNHSITTTLSLNSNNKNYKDQRELSKKNIANRKRAREMSSSPAEESSKKSRIESSSLSADRHKHKVINGYTSKSGKKHVAPESPRVPSVASTSSVHNRQVSSPHMSKVANEESTSLPHSLSDSFLMHQESTESNLSAQSLERPSRDKHKVKTTEQLIEDLQKKNNGSKIGHSIMTKLRTNQIEQEQDVAASVLPVGMKPKGKRGRPRKNEVPSMPPSNVKLSQVKNEMVERFLNTSDPAPALDDYSPFKDDLLPEPVQHNAEPSADLEACNSVYSKDNLDIACTIRQDLSEPAPKEEDGRDAGSPPLPSTSQVERTGSSLTLEEIYAQLPPVDDDIDWDAVDFFELPEPAPVTEEVVDRLHDKRLPGVNGLYDINGEWTTWQQVMTLPSYENNQLHILPYVDLDN